MAKAMFHIGLAMVVGFSAMGCKTEPAAVNPATQRTADATTRPVAATPATQPAAATPATQPVAAGETGSDSLFTLPPSKGPAAHAFKQLTLLREGVSGDLEMQLTGDGIWRIRDHGHNQSYTGNGKLEDAQIAEWATLMKDWDKLDLKDSYIPTPAPEKADKIDVMYGGKKVSFSTAGKDNPALLTEVYKRMMALNEQAKKESGVTGAVEK